MVEYQGKTFVGIAEYLSKKPEYYYCVLDTETGSMSGHLDVEDLGKAVAVQHKEQFKKGITYEPPQGIDSRNMFDEKKSLFPKRYHRLSVMEQNRFEKAVLRALKGEI